mmetsp:Transcript_25049/g.29630  ORF Transcript_25049/g.29630 Transcript_25049/m.29630 type:complete len:191 (-) Transcript_25049:95-667(-)
MMNVEHLATPTTNTLVSQLEVIIHTAVLIKRVIVVIQLLDPLWDYVLEFSLALSSAACFFVLAFIGGQEETKPNIISSTTQIIIMFLLINNLMRCTLNNKNKAMQHLNNKMVIQMVNLLQWWLELFMMLIKINHMKRNGLVFKKTTILSLSHDKKTFISFVKNGQAGRANYAHDNKQRTKTIPNTVEANI